MKASKQDLRDEIAQLRLVGHQMSNIMFNLAQDDTQQPENLAWFDRFRKMWDAIERSERSK